MNQKKPIVNTLIYLCLFFCLLSTKLGHANEEDLITLNMHDADIITFITEVGEITGEAFVIDPRVKGRVTIVSQVPMRKREVYRVFISTLNVHGYTALKTGSLTKIIPLNEVKKNAMRIATPSAPGYGDEYVTRVFKLKQLSATEVLPLFRPMLAKEGDLLALDSSNVLIMIDSARNVSRVAKLIKQMDSSNTNEVEIINVQYANATDLVDVLSQISTPVAGKKTTVDQQVKLVADERTNTILLSGQAIERDKIKTMISRLDQPFKAGAGNTKVIYLHNAKATELVKVLDGIKSNIEAEQASKTATKSQEKKEANTNTTVQTSIQADEATNALLVSARPDVMHGLEAVIKQLDIKRAQVLVEAIIVELSEDKTKELGVQWLGAGGVVAGYTSFDNTGVDALSVLGGVIEGDASEVASSLAGGLNIGIGGANDSSGFGAILNAIATDDNANILSTPSIITMDNQEASITVGQEVPFVTGSTTGSDNSNPFTTIQREKIGIQLKITPQINEGDSVRLKIYQEVSSLSSTQGASDLITNQREIDTTVLVRDGAMVVLGGLISEEHSEGEQKVPVLGDLPGIGSLFKSTSVNKVRRNLMVFLHPRIIRDGQALNDISGKKYSFIRNQQLKLQQKGIALMKDETSALLPAWDEHEVLPWKKEVSQ